MSDLGLVLGGARVLAALVIALGLLCIYRWICLQAPLLAAIVAVGLLLRVGLGLLLFGISYLNLPLWRHLHSGDGFWKLAPDAENYVALASRAISQGLGTVEAGGASPAYVKLLAVWMSIVGISPASGLFLNVVVYGALCGLVVWAWRPRGVWRDDLPCAVLLAS